MSYGELQQRANAVAALLREQGAGAGDLVGLCCDRSELMVVALYGILKSGAGFVPLDPTLPFDRLTFMAEDSARSNRARPCGCGRGTASSRPGRP